MKELKPILCTDRLELRPLERTDAPEILRLRSDATVNKFIVRTKPKNINDALVFIHKIEKGVAQGAYIFWGVCLKENSKLIGTATFWNFSKDRKTTELGYELLPEFHRKGIMSEALTAILNYGFDVLQLDAIEAFTNKDNFASYQLLYKNKFNFLPERKDEGFPDNAIFQLKNPHL